MTKSYGEMSGFAKSFARSQLLGVLGLTAWFFLLHLLANSIGQNHEELSLFERVVDWSATLFFFVGPILIGLAVGKATRRMPGLSGFLAGMLFVLLFLAANALKDQFAGFMMFGGYLILLVPILTWVGALAAGGNRVLH